MQRADSSVDIDKLPFDGALITDRLAKLTGLAAKKTYFYKITSKDASGSTVTASGTFITK